MNTAQARRIERMTNSLTRGARLSDDSWLNGPLVFYVKQDGKNLWFYATNATNESKWYETSIFVMAVIGERGGVDVYGCEGMHPTWIGPHTDCMKHERARRREQARAKARAAA